MHQRTVNVALCIAALCCMAQAPRLPGIGALDRRHPVSLAAPPFRSLLRVQTELGARCTGFLVAPALVMTAAHCLFLPRVGAYLQPSSVHVLLDYDAGAFRGHARASAFRIAPGYRPGAEAQTAGADRAVLVLDRPLGSPSDVLRLAPPPPRLPQPVRLAGYGEDRDELAVESPPCAISAVGRDGEGRVLLAHDCQATPGTSGAPLVLQQPDGRWAAVGVQIQARVGDAGGRAAPTLDPVSTTPAR